MLGTTTEKVKAVKQLLVNQIFHHHSHGHSNKGQQHTQRQNSNSHGGGIPFLRKRSSSSSGGRPLSGPAGVASRGGGGGGPGSALSASSHNIDSAGRGGEFEEERQMRRSQHRRQTSAPYSSNTLGSPERAAALRARQQQLQQQQQFSQEDQMVEGRFIGHPSSSAGAASEFAYPVVGRRGRPIQSNLPGKFEFVKQYPGNLTKTHFFPTGRHMLHHSRHYRRMPGGHPTDSSFSSFSDAGSSMNNNNNGMMARRPSVDTISTYLSGESAQQQFYRRNYGVAVSQGGGGSRKGSYGYYGGSLGSQVSPRFLESESRGELLLHVQTHGFDNTYILNFTILYK